MESALSGTLILPPAGYDKVKKRKLPLNLGYPAEFKDKKLKQDKTIKNPEFTLPYYGSFV
jgi:hypothetical protein